MRTGSDHSRLAPWTRWLVVLMAATMLLYTTEIVFQPLPPDLSDLFQKFASCFVFIVAAALCLLKGKASPDERTIWRLFALTMALYAAGQLYYALFFWTTKEPPFPSVADGLWLLFYLPAFAALYKLLRRRATMHERGAWLD